MSREDRLSPDGRWEIKWRLDKNYQDRVESETSWEVVLRDTATQKIFRRFYYSVYANSEGTTYDGVKSLEFGPDNSAVIATYADGTVETIVLPPQDKAK